MNPKVAMWLNVILAVLGFILGSSALLTPLFGDPTTAHIVGWSALAFGVLNTILHSVSAPIAGPVLRLFRKGT